MSCFEISLLEELLISDMLNRSKSEQLWAAPPRDDTSSWQVAQVDLAGSSDFKVRSFRPPPSL